MKWAKHYKFWNMSVIKVYMFGPVLMQFHANVTAHCIACIIALSELSELTSWAVSAACLIALGSVCERSFCVFFLSFRYSNYSNSFMVKYSNSKIGIRHKPSDSVTCNPSNVLLVYLVPVVYINLLKTSPEYTRAGVLDGKCVLYSKIKLSSMG